MLSDSEKLHRKRQRMIGKAREYTTGTYKNRFVAPVFQRMIRAEYGALPGATGTAIVRGVFTQVPRKFGECVCVTCGRVGPWSSGLGGMHTGHFLASRANSILFDETNVAPQCSRCNRYKNGAPHWFRQWMLAVRGVAVVERLEDLKRTAVSFSREELVDMRIEFGTRLDAAVAILNAGG